MIIVILVFMPRARGRSPDRPAGLGLRPAGEPAWVYSRRGSECWGEHECVLRKQGAKMLAPVRIARRKQKESFSEVLFECIVGQCLCFQIHRLQLWTQVCEAWPIFTVFKCMQQKWLASPTRPVRAREIDNMGKQRGWPSRTEAVRSSRRRRN